MKRIPAPVILSAAVPLTVLFVLLCALPVFPAGNGAFGRIQPGQIHSPLTVCSRILRFGPRYEAIRRFHNRIALTQADGSVRYISTLNLDPARKTVVLDAGHGGDGSPGAVYGGIMEKEITFPIILKLQALLEARGYNVILTREADGYVNLYDRAAIANAVGADAFVSVHCNAAQGAPRYQGMYVYYYPGNEESKAFAQCVQDAAVQTTGAVDRGVFAEDLVVVRETRMPAILLEAGFMTNGSELARLRGSSYQQKIAGGIAEGLDAYFSRSN